MLRAGDAAFKAADYTASERHFRMALAAGADPVQCRRHLARLYNRQGIWPQALEQWQWLHEADPDALEPLLQVARGHFRLGDDVAAQAAFEAVLQLIPDHPEARQSLHAVLLRAGQKAVAAADYAAGERHFRMALKAGADPAQCRRHLARLYDEQGIWAQALEQWQWLHEAAPGELEPLLRVAEWQSRLGDDAAAQAAFEAVLQLIPDHPEARQSLQAVLLRAGQKAVGAADYAAGERHFRMALTVGADPAQCRRHLARLYNEQGIWAQALEQWQWLHEADPEELEPLLQVARGHFRLGDDAAAQAAFEAVLQRIPDHPEARQSLQAVLLRAGQKALAAADYAASERHFRMALTAGADPAQCRRHLARLYNEQGIWAQALEEWQWLHEADPEELEPLLQVARGHFRLGDDVAAQAAFEAVLQLIPDHPEARQSLHAVLLRAGQKAVAAADHAAGERHFRMALKAGADPAQCRRHLARVYNEQGAWAQALDQWQWLHEADPEELEPLLQVARGQFRLGHDAAAQAAFEAVLQLIPDHPEARQSLQAIRTSEAGVAGASREVADWLSPVPEALRWGLAAELLASSVGALAAAIDSAIRQSAAAGRIVGAYGEAVGELGNHRRLYRIQAERTLDELRLQLKRAKGSAAELQRRTGKMQAVFGTCTGRSAAAPAAPRVGCSAWRQAALQAALALHREEGVDAAFSWLLRAGLPEDRAALLAAFGNALRDSDREAAIRGYWLAYGAAPSAIMAERMASRMFELGDLANCAALAGAASTPHGP